MTTIITTTKIVTMTKAIIIPAAIATVLDPLVEGWVLSEVGVDVVITKNIRKYMNINKKVYFLLMTRQ